MRRHFEKRRVLGTFVLLAAAAFAGGCFGSHECDYGQRRCGADPGTYQLCSGGEGYYNWSDGRCAGLDPVCVEGQAPGTATCEDHAKPPTCSTQVLSGALPANWLPKGASDFDGDGFVDLLFLDNQSVLHIVPGIGGAAFGAARDIFPVGVVGTIKDAVVADVDGDQRRDLVLVTTAGLNVELGKGDGTFTAGMRYTAGGDFLLLEAADMDGDGRDEVLAEKPLIASTIDVLSHLTEASFTDTVADFVDEFGQAAAVGNKVTPARFTTAGGLGLVGFSPSAIVLLPDGHGAFRAFTPIDGGIGVADLDDNGLADILIIGGDGTTNAALSNGDGTFRSVKGSNIPPGGKLISVADVDGDTKPDIVDLYPPSVVTVFKGNGDGTFQPAMPFATGLDPERWRLAADFDGDGRQDVAARSTSGDLLVLPGACVPK